MTVPFHQRAVIRRAVQTALIGQQGSAPNYTYATAAGLKVKRSRKWPWKTKDLPALSLYIFHEKVDADRASNQGGQEYTRRPLLAIEAGVKGVDGESVDDAVDSISREIERVMGRDQWFDSEVAELRFVQTDIDVNDDGDETVGMVRLVYEPMYRTLVPFVEDVELNDLELIDARTNLNGTQETDNETEVQVPFSPET